MYRPKIVSSVAGLSILLITLSLVNPGRAEAQQPVQVVNIPLPVTGTVNATIASGTTVNIGNPPANPVLVREVGGTKQLAHGSNGCFFSGGYCLIDLITVPTGQRLVIEHISGNIQMAPNQNVVTATVGRAYLDCCIATSDDFLVPQLLPGTSISQFNHQTLMFFDAGNTVRVLFSKDTADIGGAANVSFSGYTIPN